MSDNNRDPIAHLARKLPRSLEPPKDLWPRIEEGTRRGASGAPARTVPRRAAGRALPFVAAAAALLLVVAGVAVVPRLASRARALPAWPAGAEETMRREVAALAEQVRAAERQYREARAQLMDGLRRLDAVVSDEQLARLEREFARTDALIAKLWDQAREEPESLEPVYQLAMLYQAQTGVVTESAQYVLARAR